MATVKLVLWKNKKDQKTDNTFPIAIRITKDRKIRYVFTGKYILEKDWDAEKCKVKKSHEGSTRLNVFLGKELAKVETISDRADLLDEDLSSAQIKKKYTRKNTKVSFFKFASERIKSKHLTGTFSVSQPELSILYNIHEFITWNPALSREKIIEGINARRKERISQGRKGTLTLQDHLKFFENNTKLAFSEIDVNFLNRFKTFCAAYLAHSTRTIANELIFIRTLFNAAIQEKLVDEKHYPFGGDNEIIRIMSGNKIGCTPGEIDNIEDLVLEPETSLWDTKNVWLFAFYFAGIRVSDVVELKWLDFLDGRLYYRMNKNEKPVSLKVPEKAQKILELYFGKRSENQGFVFPFLKDANLGDPRDIFRKTRNATRLIDKNLKKIAGMCGIQKNLSAHIARHSFGNIAGDKIHPLMLQKLYRHSDLKTTLNYQSNFIHKEADDALDTVLSY
ncbi:MULTISPECIES: site-specific integrase [unclassified Spirosoma]|uniref:site-specific integrase n=1 Tax=unclassified Spirosoma TaxID=2621999 RepID=UPI00095AE25F|nr:MULTISPECIES: site-specific integrase [unclassified Spirosoma]MBN8825845.1 site-specific integrase [Spirosoma sp.]OJW70541.1 MAG: integrase [Spirosoma sp. 48-14]